MNTNELNPENSLTAGEETPAAITGDQVNEIAEETDQHDELQPVEDFSGYSREELFAKLEELFAHADSDSSRSIVQKVKDTFRELTKELNERKYREWEATKEDEHDVFMPAADQLAEKFEEVLRKYNQKRAELKRQKERLAL
jgi:hypothetical protein